MSRLLVAALLLAAVACAHPVSVRVTCDRTGSFTFVLPPAGDAGKFKMPPCDAACSSCGQECSVTVVEE